MKKIYEKDLKKKIFNLKNKMIDKSVWKRKWDDSFLKDIKFENVEETNFREKLGLEKK